MRLALALSLAMLSYSPFVLATDCDCSRQCMTDCTKNGGSEDCKCKSCACAEGGKCEYKKHDSATNSH